MKALLTAICLIFSSVVFAQTSTSKPSGPAKDKEILEVEAACGQCKLGLKGKGCDLAIRINGKSYFVDGTEIDNHGDAHADDGFCNRVRKAKVQGEVVKDRFKVSYFELLPEKKE